MKQYALTTKLKLMAVAIAIAIVGIAAHTPGTVRAASGGLTISPTAIDKEIAPGASYTGEIVVINQGELDYSYKVYASPYSVDGEEYKPYFTPVKGAVDVTSWFAFTKTGGDLQIGNQDAIPFTVAVPQGTPAGSYYATVFAETEDKGASGVVTRKRVGTVMYLRVSGKVSERGHVDSWSVPWLQKDPLTATLKQANTGSVHYPAQVKVTVSDIFGGPKFTFERKPQILPQKLRRIEVTWTNGATFGLFKVGGEVKYLGKTEKLPTKYVFVADTPMRVLTIGIVILFAASMTFLGMRRVVRKK
ncbi:MAG TPA: hypothetical protein VFT16_00290 [Candidatus Saccharimonadales bacterium]|nr:hypothetical protein [Candidatus Saccharimonadales bacterium]